jgi:hypothetical protein
MRVGAQGGMQVGVLPVGVRVGVQVGAQVGVLPVGVRVGVQVGAQVGVPRVPVYMRLGVPVGVGVPVGMSVGVEVVVGAGGVDAAPRWTGPVSVERIFLVEAAPRFTSEPQRGPIHTSGSAFSETSPLNLQRHATVKAESLFQQQSNTKQLSIPVWPSHELKPNR